MEERKRKERRREREGEGKGRNDPPTYRAMLAALRRVRLLCEHDLPVVSWAHAVLLQVFATA